MDSTTITLFKQILKGAGLIAENDMPDNTDDATLIDEVVEFAFGEKKSLKHRAAGMKKVIVWLST